MMVCAELSHRNLLSINHRSYTGSRITAPAVGMLSPQNHRLDPGTHACKPHCISGPLSGHAHMQNQSPMEMIFLHANSILCMGSLGMDNGPEMKCTQRYSPAPTVKTLSKSAQRAICLQSCGDWAKQACPEYKTNTIIYSHSTCQYSNSNTVVFWAVLEWDGGH